MPKTKTQKSKANLDIDHIAKLANIPLTTEEKKLYKKQLVKILEYIDKLEEKANTAKVDPTFNVSPNTNIMRSDVTGTGLTQQEALTNAGSTDQGQFLTKGILENE